MSDLREGERLVTRRNKAARYKMPPRKVFRQMGLGVEKDGHIRVIAGFRFQWWNPFASAVPLIVNARIIRRKRVDNGFGTHIREAIEIMRGK